MSKNLNASSKFHDAITKRDILHGHKKVDDAQKVNLGLEFAKEGWISDAIDFLTTDAAQLEKMKAAAIAEGNVFLLSKIFRVLGQENNDELFQAALKAEEQGKIRYAIKAYEKLGQEDKVSALKTLIAGDGDMKTELNSVFIPKSEEEREEEEN